MNSPDLLSPFDWSHRFDDLQKIGSGAMGQVWRAREVLTGRIVALKLLDPARSGDEQTLARLEMEGETLTRLREAGAHDHVVPILDFKITREHGCIVMEYVPGLNLKNWCSTHQSNLSERVKLIAQVARAAGWFHGLGVVHRDLKPANILVHAITRQPVVVDFSIAKQDAGLTLTLTNEALGTAPYMAPEQIDRARGEISPATDVYALGATLYELLTQVHPHPGDLPQVVRRHAEEIRPAPPSVLNPEVPRDLECIILKALSHRLGDRYANGIALAEDLDRFLAGEPVQARPLPLVTHVIRRARRKPALTAALAACLILGAFALWNMQHEAAQRARFTLETQLTTAMQQEIWDESSLTTAETTLSTLARQDAALATTLRQRLHLDVTHDIEFLLQQPHLRDEDFTWLHRTAEWLHHRLPEQAAHLQGLITERAGRWELLAEVRSPFADMQGLFPNSQFHMENDLLHLKRDEADASHSAIITDAVSVPLEIDCKLVAPRDTFLYTALRLTHANVVISAVLCKTTHAKGVLHLPIFETENSPEGFIFYLLENARVVQHLQIPDTHFLDKTFRLTLRVERERAETILDDRWSLRLDSPFALGSTHPNNNCRISLPIGTAIQHLALRTRRADLVSPLEEADLLAAQGHWPAARRLYENLRGDPHFGNEANFKITLCLWREGEHAAARSEWEKFIPKPPSTWRDRSLLHLAMFTLLKREWDTATRYLHLLPENIPPSVLGQLDSQLSDDLSELLMNTSLSIVEPRPDGVALTAVTQAFQVLQTPPLDLANRLGMPLHFSQKNKQAAALYATALLAKASRPKGPSIPSNISNSLDQWCRLLPSENGNQLTNALALWKETTNGQAIWRMEQARKAARAGKLPEALPQVRQALEKPANLDTRLHTSLWLLDGMLHRLQQDEAKAQQAWQKGRQIAATVTQRHPLHLFDSILLHSLTQSWSRKTMGDVLTTFASRHLAEKDRPAAQAAFDAVFLADPAWITTFNTVLQSEEGQKFAEDAVLCRQQPRALFQHLHRLLFEHYFLSTAFPKPTPEESLRVHAIVDTLITEMTTNPRGEIAHLYAYLRAWNDPAAAKVLFDQTYPYSPALIEDMKWLLQQRFE